MDAILSCFYYLYNSSLKIVLFIHYILTHYAI